jgi:hypothetical protein
VNTPSNSTKASRKGRWDAAILALLQNATREKAAEQAGVDPATLYRWQKDSKFQEALREARHEVFSQATGRLQQAANTAVDTLIGIMHDPDARGRVQAARCVLELSRKSLEVDDLRMQVAELRKWQRGLEERSQQYAESSEVN